MPRDFWSEETILIIFGIFILLTIGYGLGKPADPPDSPEIKALKEKYYEPPYVNGWR